METTERVRPHLPPVLVGREEAMAVLAGALRSARRGHAEVVTVEAEPGMGKTELARALCRSLPDTDRVRWIGNDEVETDIPFGLVARLVGDAAVTEGSVVAAGRGLLAWLAGQQEQCPGAFVLVVDDAQWVDRCSVDATRFALRRLDAERVLCLVLRRPVPQGLAEIGRDDPSGVRTLTLGRLDASLVRALAERIWSVPVPTAVAQDVATRTGGLPLLVSAVLNGATGPEDLVAGHDLPRSVGAAVQRMMASMAPPGRRLVQACAILGVGTPPAVVARVAGLTDATAAVAAAVAAGLVKVSARGEVECAYDALRQTVENLLSLAERRELHGRAASLTEGDRRLAHRAAASDHFDPGLTRDLVDAADDARAAAGFARSAAHRLRARTVCADGRLRDRLHAGALLDLVRAEDLHGARELSPMVTAQPATALRDTALGLLAREEGDVVEARRLLVAATERALTEDDDDTAGAAVRAAAELEVRLGNGPDALEILERAPEGLLERTDPTAALEALALWQSGELAAAEQMLGDLAGRSPGEHQDPDRLIARATVALCATRLGDALRILDVAAHTSHRWRTTSDRARVHTLRAVARFLSGDWDGSQADTAAARTLTGGPTAPWAAAAACAASVDVPAHRGQWAVAAGHLAAAKAAWPPAAPVTLVALHEVTLAAARHDHAGVLAVLDPIWDGPALDAAERMRLSPPLFAARITARIGLGQLAQAEADLARFERTTDRWPGGITPARLGWLHGLLSEAQGRPTRARTQYAGDLADPGLEAFPFLHAQVLYDLGRLDRAMGNRREAVDELARARDIFARLGAEPSLQRCADELRATGQRVRATGQPSLTAREEDVAALVARGYTNREIGAELYLTGKTVEFHLRNIYAKLGVGGRVELRRLRTVSVA